MTIIDKIRHSVEGAAKMKLHYQSAEQLNRIADYTDYPCAFLFLLQSQGLNIENSNYRERLQVAIFFVTRSEFDFRSEENERLIDDCKQAAYRWLQSLRRDKYLRLEGVNGTERVYDYFDAQLTGYAVNVTVEELTGYCANG